MKQILTIFRASGAQARRVLQLCRTTRKAQLLDLRDVWRLDVRMSARLSAYVEYLDGWSTGDDFARVMGTGATRRMTLHGELYFRRIDTDMLAELRRLRRQKQQFLEQTEFLRVIDSLAGNSGGDAVVVFREIVGLSVTDDEIKEGASQSLHTACHLQPLSLAKSGVSRRQ